MNFTPEERLGHQLDTCLQKFRHETRASAIGHATRVLRATGDYLQVYVCPFRPDHWHVGHPVKK